MADVGIGIHRVIQDADGESATVTSGKLDVNATLVGDLDLDIGNVDMHLNGGVPLLGNAGAVAAGVLRVTLASDDPAVVSLDEIESAIEAIEGAVDGSYLNVNMNLAGSDAQAGEGAITSATQRVTIATDDDGVAHLATIAGAVDTQLQVDVVAISGQSDGTYIGDIKFGESLPAGSNTIGVVDLGSTDNAVLDAIASSLEILDDWDDSNYANINLNIAGTDVDGNSGNKSAQSQRVVIATDDVNMSAIKTAVEIIDNAIDGSEMQVDIVSSATLSVNSHAVTNAGTFAVQVDGSALTALQLIDDAIYVDDADWDGTSKHMLVGGLYGSNTITSGDVGPIALAADGAVHINDGGNTITVDGTVTANLGTTDNAVLDAMVVDLAAIEVLLGTIDTDTSTLAAAVSTQMQVDVVGALPTGLAKIGRIGHDITGLASDDNDTVGTSAEKISGADGDVACKRVDIMAHPDNTGYIWIGDSLVSVNGLNGGIRLSPGDFYSMDIDNTGDVYAIATVDGENVCFNYFT